jgi:hypothetical protein
MHLRDLVKQRWAEAGLYARKNAHLQSFLKHVDGTPMECWDDYAVLFRRQYYDLFDQLIPPLLRADDKLLRIALIRQADFTQPKELKAARAFVRAADPVRDRPELNAILNRSGKLLRKDFLARPELKHLAEPKPVPQRRPTNMVRPPPAKRKGRPAP